MSNFNFPIETVIYQLTYLENLALGKCKHDDAAKLS
jgi:hypothetical protein